MVTGKRYGPDDPLPLAEIVWPARHAPYWYSDGDGGVEAIAEIRQTLPDDGDLALEIARDIAQTATDRAAAADRRATAIAGTVAIAASFTLSGGAIAIDSSKIQGDGIRIVFGAVLCATTLAFVLSAVYALSALVATRTWNWASPNDLRPHALGDPNDRAARLLSRFSRNWEISDVKNRHTDRSLAWLLLALAGIVVLAGVMFWAVLDRVAS